MKFSNVFLLVSVPAVAALDSRLTAVKNQINSIRHLHLGKNHVLPMNEAASKAMATHCNDPAYWDSGEALNGHLMLHTTEQKAGWNAALSHYQTTQMYEDFPREADYFPYGLTWTTNAQGPRTDGRGNVIVQDDQWKNGVGQWYSERDYFLEHDMWYGETKTINGKYAQVGHVLSLVDRASTEMACAICSGRVFCNFKYDQNEIDSDAVIQVNSESRRPEFVTTLTLPSNTLTTDQVVNSIRTLANDGVPAHTTLFYDQSTTLQEADSHGTVFVAGRRLRA